MKNSIFFRIFLGYGIIILLLAGGVAVFAPGPMKSRFIEEQASQLEHIGALLQGPVAGMVSGGGQGLQDYVMDASRKTSARITVIKPDGTVLAESEMAVREMENHLYRPEIFAALRGERKLEVRVSSSLRREMMYMGFPLRSGDTIIGVLRVSMFTKDLDALFGRLRTPLLMIIGIVTLVAIGAGIFVARSISKPLREFIQGMTRVAGGDFKAKVSLLQQGGFKEYAVGFNAMTERLQAMFQQIRLETDELNSILTAIKDGLCLLDADGRIVLFNEGFSRIVNIEPVAGKYYWEVVRSSRLAEVIRGAKGSGRTASEEISLGDRIYASSISPLTSGDRSIVLLRDITEFRNLEKIKKDFVVNVSHELKTPLAAVKGFVETMEPSIGEENRSYLEIVKRNTDRLIAIVDDLLILSRLEEKGTKIDKEPVDVRAVVATVLKIFERRAADKGLTISIEAPSDLPPVMADPFEMERLFINLLDNALKYTDKGGVVLRLGSLGQAFTIEVADTGLGIDTEHLAHIFERFYVVDKSRSKKLGGTGLGLSIVKHIVLAHHGTITVKSRVGVGTTFSIVIPNA